MLKYKKFKMIDGELTGDFYDFDAAILKDILDIEFGLGSQFLETSSQEIQVKRLGDTPWTPEEITQIDALILAHGSEEAVDAREALKECYTNRIKAYNTRLGSITDQLDAIIKGGDAFTTLQEEHAAIKNEFPLPKQEARH